MTTQQLHISPRWIVALLVLVSAVTLFSFAFAGDPQETTATPSADYVPDQVIIAFAESSSEQDRVRVREELKATFLEKLTLIDAEVWGVPTGTVDSVIESFKTDRRIRYIQPNYIYSIAKEPNDPNFGSQWGLFNRTPIGGDSDIDATEAWDRITGTSIVVGVIDSGIDYTHPDLAANMWTNPGEIPGNGNDDDNNGYIDDIHGYDFVANDGDPMDENKHGTHVSGIIAARGNNGIGVTGVNWSAQLMALRFLNASGRGKTSNAVKAIDYAIRMNAKMTNNSWGSTRSDSALEAAIQRAQDAGQLFISAAGNDGTNNDLRPFYPANYRKENTISVAASTMQDQLASFSNFGTLTVDLAAPGERIYSTLPSNQYGALSGTSMAAPFVTGAAALVWANEPSLTFREVKQRILDTVDIIPDFGGRLVTNGRLNVGRAVGWCLPPKVGSWLISSSCSTTGSQLSRGNVTVLPGSQLTVPANSMVDIDFLRYALRVQHGGGVLIKTGGSVR